MLENEKCTEDNSKTVKKDDFTNNDLFTRIAQSKAVIKSQQRGDTELTFQEKLDHLSKIYDKSRVTFLQRFGIYMKLQDLELLNEPDNYEVQFYVKKYKTLLDPLRREKIVRNRRYNYLKKELRNTEYFGDTELENRNPLLYKQYIGQYENEIKDGKRSDRSDGGQKGFSDFLFSNIDHSINNFRCELEETAAQECESESESEESDIEKDEDFMKYLDGKIPMDSEEKLRLREEFLCLMEKKFLDGEDCFDYDIVDHNERYDDLFDQDIEDRYFDEEGSDINDSYFDEETPD